MRRSFGLLRTVQVAAAPLRSSMQQTPLVAAAAAVATRTAAVRAFSTEGFLPKTVFSSFKVFKSKTALDVAIVRAQLAWNGVDKRYLKLARAGGLRLSFAAGENRSYDWQNSSLITLGVTELGDILAFAANKAQPEHKFFHDPAMGGEQAGKTRKELVVKRIGENKPGYFFNFSVTAEGEAQKKFSIAVSEGEFQVLLTIIQQTLPQLLALNTKPTIAELPNA